MTSSGARRSTVRGAAAGSVVLCFTLAGCPGSSEPPTVDAGPPPVDAPPALDAPATPDAPDELDAGRALDATADTAMRSDAPILSPIDAGDPFGDAGALGPPAWVPIEVRTRGTCDPLVPCGGDVVGTWDVTGACVEVPIPDALFECPGATATGTGMARGRVTFDGTIAVRTAQSIVNVEVFVPSLCAGFIGGCGALETMLESAVADSACVTEPAGCRCAARQAFEIDDGDAYTVEGNEIVSATLMKRWAYCITGDGLRYQDTTPAGSSAPREAGIIELGRR